MMVRGANIYGVTVADLLANKQLCSNSAPEMCFPVCLTNSWSFQATQAAKVTSYLILSSIWSTLTTVGVAPLLQVGVAVQAAVSRGDVLWGAGDGRLGHDRVWVRWLVHRFEFQPLVVNPKIRWFQVFGVSLVFMGAVGGLGGSPLSAKENMGDDDLRNNKSAVKQTVNL